MLCRLLDIDGVDDVAALTVRAFPGEEVPARGLELVGDVLARPHPP